MTEIPNTTSTIFVDLILNILPEKNSAVIPYNTAFMDAQCDGKVVNLLENTWIVEKNTNYYFISKSIAASEKLLKVASLEKSHQNGAYKYGRFIKQ